MFKDLLKDEDCVDGDSSYVAFQPATFTRDFGCFKKDEVVDFLEFNLDDGEVKELDENDNVRRKCKFQLVALPE